MPLTKMLPGVAGLKARVATENAAVAGVAGVAGFFKGNHGRSRGVSGSWINSKCTPFCFHRNLQKSGNSGNTGNTFVIAPHSDECVWQQTGNTGNRLVEVGQ